MKKPKFSGNIADLANVGNIVVIILFELIN